LVHELSVGFGEADAVGSIVESEVVVPEQVALRRIGLEVLVANLESVSFTTCHDVVLDGRVLS